MSMKTIPGGDDGAFFASNCAKQPVSPSMSWENSLYAGACSLMVNCANCAKPLIAAGPAPPAWHSFAAPNCASVPSM